MTSTRSPSERRSSLEEEPPCGEFPPAVALRKVSGRGPSVSTRSPRDWPSLISRIDHQKKERRRRLCYLYCTTTTTTTTKEKRKTVVL
mmetsp:Transcript_93/g.338  ORF Transcript_93/g.338 Transcript_93/m.338 type:complete len:88 (+) Transcript_93:178-441(+)